MDGKEPHDCGKEWKNFFEINSYKCKKKEEKH